jgi:hypothetical protein
MVTRTFLEQIGELPSYLRLALEKYAEEKSREDSATLKPLRLELVCVEEEVPRPHRTHADFGPRPPRSHQDPLAMCAPPGGESRAPTPNGELDD